MFPSKLIWILLRRIFFFPSFERNNNTIKETWEQMRLWKGDKSFQKAHSGMWFSLGTQIKIFHKNSDFCCEPYLNVFFSSLSLLLDFVKERRQIVKLCRVKVSRRGKMTTTSRLQRRSFSSHLLTRKEKGCRDNKWMVFWLHLFDVKINKSCF